MPDQWPIEQIETHVDDARGRFTSQYAEAELLKGLSDLWAERIQSLEDAAWSVLTERWLDVAVGQQLNELGAVVGEPRLGRSDEPYREAIQTRISINQSGGEPERIIEFLVRIAGADNVFYQERYPAKIELAVNGDVSLTQAQRVREIVPAGVGTIYISETGENLPFGTKDGPDDEPTNVDGVGELGIHQLELDDGSLLELSDGSVLGVTDRDDPILPTEGGTIAELFEV